MFRPQSPLAAASAAAALVLLAAPALARQPSGSPPPVPDTEGATITRGPSGPNPDPGARGPYVGHSERQFYDVGARIDRVAQRIQTNLHGADRAKALRILQSIRAEEKSQIARHGGLHDWARENLNHRLDILIRDYPGIGGEAGGPAG